MHALLWSSVLMSLLVLCTSDCAGICDLSPLTCNYITYPVYTDGLDLVQVNKNVTDKINEANRLKPVLPACYKSIQLFTCTYYYPSCDDSGKRMKPCRDTCTTTKDNCQLALSSFPAEDLEKLNCDSDFYEQSNTNCARLTDITPAPCNGSVTPVTGACYDYDPALSVYTGDLCAPFVSKKIYLDTNNATEEQIIIDAALNSIIGLSAKIYPLTPMLCYQSLLSLMCRSFFPTCDLQANTNDSGKQSIAVSSLPCRSVCEKTNELCIGLFEVINQTQFDCDAPFLGSISWEKGPTYVTTSNSQNKNVTTTCVGGLFATDAYTDFHFPVVTSCPYPLALNPSPNDNERMCWVPCPDPTYSKSEWWSLIVIGKVFASISFVCTVFMIASSLLDGKRRKFPANLHIFEYVSAMLISIAFFLGGPDPRENVWCDDLVTYATLETNAQCGAQGFIFVFSILSVMLWWLILSANMFLAVVLGKRKQLQFYQFYYYGIGFGIPLIFTIIAAATGHIGYVPPSPVCFITSKGFSVQDGGHHGLGPDYTLYYIPIGIVILLASSMFAAVLVKVIKIRQSTVELAGASSVPIKVQARLMVFVATLLILFVLIFEWRFTLEASDPANIKKVDLAWSVCKIKIQLGIPNPGDCPGSDFPMRFSYSHTAFETWLASSMGIFLFLIFGSEKTIYRRWYFMFTLAKHGQWDELVAFIKDSAPNSGTSQRESQRVSRLSVKNSSASRGESSASESSAEPHDAISFEVKDLRDSRRSSDP